MRILKFLVALCLLAYAVPAEGVYPWCAEMDRITAEASGGDLVLVHELATYNCCPDSFTYTLEIDGSTLTVTEHEQLTMPCDCLCCFDLGATVTGLAAGDWTVVYRWLDDRLGWAEETLAVTLGAGAKTGPALAGRLEDTGCLDASGVSIGARPAVILGRNHPNPFHAGTRIAFETPVPLRVSLRVYDAAGRLVRTLLSDVPSRAGANPVHWDGRGDNGRAMASGVYFFRLTAGSSSDVGRMILIR